MEHIQDYHVQGDYNTRMIQMRNDKFRDDIKWPTSLTLQSILLCTSEPKILSCLFTKLRLSLDGKSSNQLFFHPVEVVGTSVGLTRPFEISRQKMFLLLI